MAIEGYLKTLDTYQSGEWLYIQITLHYLDAWTELYGGFNWYTMKPPLSGSDRGKFSSHDFD